MENLRPSIFGLIKMLFRVLTAKKRSAKIFGKEIRPQGFREMDKDACPSKFGKTQVPLE